MVKSIRTLQFGMAPAAFTACNPNDPSTAPSDSPTSSDRCAYPDMLQGAWNATLTYRSPTLITLPHFFKVCRPILGKVCNVYELYSSYHLLHLCAAPTLVMTDILQGLPSRGMSQLFCNSHPASTLKKNPGPTSCGRQTPPLLGAQAPTSPQTPISTTRSLAWSPRLGSPSRRAVGNTRALCTLLVWLRRTPWLCSCLV